MVSPQSYVRCRDPGVDFDDNILLPSRVIVQDKIDADQPDRSPQQRLQGCHEPTGTANHLFFEHDRAADGIDRLRRPTDAASRVAELCAARGPHKQVILAARPRWRRSQRS